LYGDKLMIYFLDIIETQNELDTTICGYLEKIIENFIYYKDYSVNLIIYFKFLKFLIKYPNY
jgi:hypothetical protein